MIPKTNPLLTEETDLVQQIDGPMEIISKLKDFKYRVYLKWGFDSYTVQNWLRDHNMKYYATDLMSNDGMTMWFSNEKDAFLFKLRWQ